LNAFAIFLHRECLFLRELVAWLEWDWKEKKNFSCLVHKVNII